MKKDRYLCGPVRKERGAVRKAGASKGKTEDEKINHFLFGSQKKIPTFALPTETKGKREIRWRMSRRSTNKDQNERKQAKDDQDLCPMEARRYTKEAAARFEAEQVLKRDVNVAQAG